MAGKKDIVEQALKLVFGGAKEAAPKAAIRAYHVSPHDFDVFKPSEFRGSTFFSSTPERAKRGAEAGRNEMVMETATELPPVNWRTYEVEIDPSRVKGLSLTPSESKWFEGLPKKIIGDDALAEATKGIPPGMYWDDFYDEAPVAEGVYEYIKKPTPPSISYEDAVSKNRDIYRKQWPHYAGAVTDEKSSASRLNEQGMGGYLVQDEGGLSFAINDPSIVKILKKYASGGSVREGYQTKGRVVGDIVDQALKLVMGAGEQAAPVSRIGMSYKDVTKRVPELTEAAKRLQAGEIGQPEYSAIVDRFKPVEPYASVPDPASLEDMVRALTANKREKIGKLADYPEGHPVALRLDIPAYTGHGVWVPTIHDQKTFKSISHEPAAHITGAQFSIPENKALAVAAGGAKGPFATIDGSLLKTPPEVIHERAKAAMNDPDWVQVGMDPERHSYFYDRKTMQPVISAEEVIQVGPLVLARKPVYGNAEGFKYSKGGSIRQGYGPGGWVDDVVKMAGKVISGEGEDAAKAGIRAYQGSPHNFAAERLVRFPTGKEEYIVGQPDVLPDVPEGAEVIQDFPLGRMRMDKIGTGEGAQAYGHGLYFAEREGVAKGYRDALTDPEQVKIRINDKHIPSVWVEDLRSTFPEMYKGLNEADQDVMDSLLGTMESAYSVRDAANAAESVGGRAKALFNQRVKPFVTKPEVGPGSMYEVSINADPNTFLDWDKPLSEQSEAVKNAFRSMDIADESVWPKISASDAYEMLRVDSMGDDAFLQDQAYRLARRREAGAGASGMLHEAGIPGIKYLDAGSRGAGDGTRNYVVFDDKLISIIRKYGIAGASAMLGYNLMEQLDPKQALAASMADQDYQASRPQRSMGGNNSISGALNVARGLNGDR